MKKLAIEGKGYCIFGNSKQFHEKQRCGDFFQIEELLDDNIVALVMDDGVGLRHHDYAASEIACMAFLESFRNSSVDNIHMRIEQSIRIAGNIVSNLSYVEYML